MTPMEETFGINNVALVGGQPRTLGLQDLLRSTSTSASTSSAAAPPSAGARRGSAAPRRRPADRDPGHRRGHRDHPGLRGRRRRPARLIQVFDLSELQADLHPRPAVAPADEVLAARARVREAEPGRQIEELDAILDDERCCAAGVRRARRGGQAHGTPRARCCSSPRASPRRRGAARGARRPVLGAAVLHRSAGAHADAEPLGDGGRPSTTRSSRRSGPRRAARSRWSPRAAGPAGFRRWSCRAAAHRRRPAPGGWRAAGGLRRPALGRGAADPEPSPGVRGLALGTAQGVVKRVKTDHPGRDEWEVIRAQATATRWSARSSCAPATRTRLHHLRSPAAALPGLAVRPQGRTGRRHGRDQVGAGARVVSFGAVDRRRRGPRGHRRRPSAPCRAPSPAR